VHTCSIKPLFANKPLLVVVNKTDVRPLEGLGPEEQALLQHMEDEARRISSGGEGGWHVLGVGWNNWGFLGVGGKGGRAGVLSTRRLLIPLLACCRPHIRQHTPGARNRQDTLSHGLGHVHLGAPI
jgi:hypothetical protein